MTRLVHGKRPNLKHVSTGQYIYYKLMLVVLIVCLGKVFNMKMPEAALYKFNFQPFI